MNEKIKFSDDQHNNIIAALRRALDKTKHHARFGRGGRFSSALKHELSGAFDVDKLCIHTSPDKISIWGCGVRVDDGVTLFGGLSWDSPCKGEPWFTAIAKEIEIADKADYNARLQQEAILSETFNTLEKQIVDLNFQIACIRRHGHAHIKRMPVPSSATIRKDHHCWERPSSQLSAKFPNLFPV